MVSFVGGSTLPTTWSPAEELRYNLSMKNTYKIGDIVVDISASYTDLNLHGVITDIIDVMGKTLYHVRFFQDVSEIIPLYDYEIRKVS